MVGLFLGKFQPPHLGHIRTIIKLSKEYTKLIVGITKSEPHLISFQEVKYILDEVLNQYKNIEVVLIEGSIEGGTASLNNIDFDVILSGNHKVLNILSDKGFKTRFIERTEGVGYSGSEIRSLAHIVSESSTQGCNNNEASLMLVSDMKPLEKVLPSHYKNIEDMIFKDGVIKKPIIVDSKFNIVLDGSHRYAFLLKFGFKYAPVIKVDYSGESIFVGNHLKHRYLKDDSFTISKTEVINRALSENLYDARTTRHFFPFRKTDHVFSLERLEQGIEKDISFLLQDITIEQEIAMDESYIQELEEEIDILKDYEEEQKGVKKYLQEQIKMMQSIKLD